MQRFLLSASFFYLLFFLEVAVISPHKRIEHSKKKLYMLFIPFVLALAYISFAIYPPENWDSTRHFFWLDNIRKEKLSLHDLLFDYKGRSKIAGAGQPILITYNLYRFIFAHLSINNHWLVFVSTLIDYSISSFIFIDWACSKRLTRIECVLSWIINMVALPVTLAMTGIRNGLAVNIFALGLYLYFYKQKHIFLYLILSFMAITIHVSVLMFFGVGVAVKIFSGKKALCIVIPIALMFNIIATSFCNSNNLILRYIALKYLDYSGDAQFRNNIMSLATAYYLVLVFLFCYCKDYVLSSKQSFLPIPMHNDTNQSLINFFAIYCFFILTQIGNYDLVIRPVYLIGVLAPLYIHFIFSFPFWKRNKTLSVSLIGILLLPFIAIFGYRIMVLVYHFAIKLHYFEPVIYTI